MRKEEATRAIRAALERDPDINLHHYPIRITVEADTVRLEGVVENIIAKRRALQLARQALSSARIDDRLKLAIAQPQEDQELAQTVVRTLVTDPVFANFKIGIELQEQAGTDWIGVRAEDGKVHLYGAANSLSHRRMAEVLAWWVRGCSDVDNRIRVEPREQDNDAEISDAIRLVFDKDPNIDSQQVAVTTRDREVYLTGAVPSEETRRILSYDCWYIPGVHAVHNDVAIRRNRNP
ncbi:hypothetical protein CAI21_17730 [Alkalilimnicola ehrlichii]|uniref:BON domain-containing protein n=1 Tax=Alkalilimnicola ehrlichii TaxID=351052 RepID=A0A3E0WK83_9GAMM|nr:BON domain-containing protein [Alkalilimnicola ehrlichii]RFA26170.1 hypothetical protein CAI21_17730 [Alkalilimnicola ehrlichii]RFA32335.1 hypothetical protein CAL65_19815 [Alkalilimnicola ehrlichii]